MGMCFRKSIARGVKYVKWSFFFGMRFFSTNDQKLTLGRVWKWGITWYDPQMAMAKLCHFGQPRFFRQTHGWHIDDNLFFKNCLWKSMLILIFSTWGLLSYFSWQWHINWFVRFCSDPCFLTIKAKCQQEVQFPASVKQNVNLEVSWVIGVPLVIIHVRNWDFPGKKASILGQFMDPPIWFNHVLIGHVDGTSLFWWWCYQENTWKILEWHGCLNGRIIYITINGGFASRGTDCRKVW